MADAFTTNLNLDKPVVGASSDAWGTSLNADLDALDAMLGGVIYGLTLSTAGSSSTFGVAAGGASGMALASAYTKTTGSWAVGTGNGALDTGAVANSTWYHVWLIQRVDTGVVDVLISTSATSPTMPANYTRKRRIGAMLTDGSAHWVKFSQNGNEFLWDAPVQDLINTTPPDTSAHLVALTVPLGVVTNALTLLRADYASAGSNFYVTSPAQSASTNGLTCTVTVGTAECYVPLSVRTNTSSQIRLQVSNVGCTYSFFTTGWIDTRGA